MQNLLLNKPVCLLLTACLSGVAYQSKAEVFTTTQFGPPTGFGYVLDGRLFEGSSYIGREVVQIRVFWDVVVPEGFDAANIQAGVILPILVGNDSIIRIDLDGPDLGWAGSGTFNHASVIDKNDMAFGPAGIGWTHQALGLPIDIPDVLPSSRIEIDFIIDLPGDLNEDGDIDDSDLGTAFANYTGPVGRIGFKSYADGDTDFDGDVDDSDLGTLFAGFTGPVNPTAPTSVPEPTSLACLGLGLMLIRRRR